MPWRGPEYEGEVPTLGWNLLDWMEEYLTVPDGPAAGEPLGPTTEQAQFILDLYKLDLRKVGNNWRGPIVGRSLINARQFHRALLSRPKGWGKSPLLSAIGITEAVGDVVFDGFDADGEPVGRPWTTLGFKAKVQLLAVSEDQTENSWDPLLEMVRSSAGLIDDYGLVPMETFISGPRVRIEAATSAGDSREGGRPVAALMDQTESWRRGNGGTALAAAVRRNLTKTQGVSIESPNAYVPGDKTVAEQSFAAAIAQQKRRARPTILVSHRQPAEEVDVYDEAKLRAGLAEAYGDSADVNGGWVNLDRVVEDFWDPDNTVEDSRRYFLNQILHRADSWLTDSELRAATGPDTLELAPNDVITLGFDGSRGRTRGVTDATALIACRVRDAALFEILGGSVWEQPAKWPRNTVWSPPVGEIEATVAKAFATYRVVGFYADPAKWESYVAGWEAKWGRKLKAKASARNPIVWWMTGGRAARTVKALQQFKDAVLDQELQLDPAALTLRQHLLHARTVPSTAGIQIAKPHPDSEDKIDAGVAAVLAWQARLDAIAAGVLKRSKPRRRTQPRKIR